MTDSRPDTDQEQRPTTTRRSRAVAAFVGAVALNGAAVAAVAYLLWRAPGGRSSALLLAAQGALTVAALCAAYVIVSAGRSRLHDRATINRLRQERKDAVERADGLALDLRDRTRQFVDLDAEVQVLRESAAPRPVADGDAAEMIERLNAEHADQVALLRHAAIVLDEDNAAKLQAAAEQIATLTRQVESLTEQITAGDTSVDGATTVLAAQHAAEVEMLTARYEGEIEALRAEVEAAHAVPDERVEALTAHLDAVTVQHAEQVQALTAQQEAEVAATAAAAQERENALTAQHAADVEALTARYEGEIETLRAEVEAAATLPDERVEVLNGHITALNEHIEAVHEHHRAEMDALAVQHEAALADLRAAQAEHAQADKDAHEEQVRLLRTLHEQEVLALNAEHAAALARVRADAAQDVAQAAATVVAVEATADSRVAVLTGELTEVRDALDTLRVTSASAVEHFRAEAEAARTEERLRTRVVIEAILPAGEGTAEEHSLHRRALRALERLGPVPAVRSMTPVNVPPRAAEPDPEPEAPRRRRLGRR